MKKKNKILIVDDDPLFLEAAENCLCHDGYEIVTAVDGMNALDKFREQKPDLIISDILMPELSGLGFLSLMKRFYYNRVPIILISSLDKTEVILTSLGLGAEDFVTKPVNFAKLSVMVKRCLEKFKLK